MNRRLSVTAGLLAPVAALLLAAGAVPAVADRPKVKKVNPPQDAFEHYAPDKVVVTFSDDPPEDTAITVTDRCKRKVSARKTKVAGDRASVAIKKKPKGLYRVTIAYTVESDDPEPSPSPGESPSPGSSPGPEPTEDPPDEAEPEEYRYSFRVHRGPSCEGGDGPKDKKQYSWGSTNKSNNHHGHGDHDSSNPNVRTAGPTDHAGDHAGDSTSSSSHEGDHAFANPSATNDHSEHDSSDFSDDFSDSAFNDTPGDTPLSDPTDPSLDESQPEVAEPEGTGDQSLSASPADVLEPSSGVLLIALASALLLGAGGGLFLRKADRAPAGH